MRSSRGDISQAVLEINLFSEIISSSISGCITQMPQDEFSALHFKCDHFNFYMLAPYFSHTRGCLYFKNTREKITLRPFHFLKLFMCVKNILISSLLKPWVLVELLNQFQRRVSYVRRIRISQISPPDFLLPLFELND